MNKEELRIGNIFELDEIQQGDLISKYVRITSLSEKAAHWVSVPTNGIIGRCHSGTNYKDIVPIPLTEELLLKIGFKRNGNYWDKGCFSLPIHPTKSGGEFILVPNNFVAAIPLKYLHQLQNLYFALTGEELTISL